MFRTPCHFAAACWSNFGKIHLFALSQSVGLVLLEVLLLGAVLGMIGESYGAFNVVWFESAPGTSWYKRAIFWNGFGVAVFFLTIAYMTYLMYAHSEGQGAKWGWERFLLYFGKAAV